MSPHSDSPHADTPEYDRQEIDRLAREGEKSAWQPSTAPAAGDPVSADEKAGLNVLGQNDPRGNGAIDGVSDPNPGDVRGHGPDGADGRP